MGQANPHRYLRANMTPADEMRELLERASDTVLDNVDGYGFSIPVCVGRSPPGEEILLCPRG